MVVRQPYWWESSFEPWCQDSGEFTDFATWDFVLSACFGLSGGYLWNIPFVSTFPGLGVANTCILVTFWNFYQLFSNKGGNRIPKLKPKLHMNFSPKLSSVWARSSEQCSSAALPSDYITSQGAGVHLPSSRAQQPWLSSPSNISNQPASAARRLSSILQKCDAM